MNELKVVQGPGRTNFAGNDYLGLARDPRVIEAMYDAAREFGISSTSSRWGLGWLECHAELERQLAEFFETEDATILGATFLGGPAYFHARSETHKTVFMYEHSHSNLFIGARAAGFDVRTFAHGDVAGLRAQFEAAGEGPAIIATDGVYSISGDYPPLVELCDLAREFDAELLVDDAHGVFAVGDTGKGIAEFLGLAPTDAVLMGSMSKALGCNGGFFAGSHEIVDKVRRSPPASGSAITPAPVTAACIEALRIVREEPELRDRLRANAARMRSILADCDIGVVSEDTPILSMVLADDSEAAGLAEHFFAYDIVIRHFTYGSEGRHNRLRSVARACYTEAELDRFAEAVSTWRER